MLIANDEGYIVGAVYLTKHNEIGVRVFKSERGKGYGRFALMAIMGRHPGERLRANINPRNEKALRMFSTFGFRLSQVTVEATVQCE
jgi:RimJ/RimL family protein N-acetyltransferase